MISLVEEAFRLRVAQQGVRADEHERAACPAACAQERFLQHPLAYGPSIEKPVLDLPGALANDERQQGSLRVGPDECDRTQALPDSAVHDGRRSGRDLRQRAVIGAAPVDDAVALIGDRDRGAGVFEIGRRVAP